MKWHKIWWYIFISYTYHWWFIILFVLLQDHSTKVMRLFADIFGWLPLATVVNNKILVTHGGISNITDLAIIDKIDRHKVSMNSWSISGELKALTPLCWLTWTTPQNTYYFRKKNIYIYAQNILPFRISFEYNLGYCRFQSIPGVVHRVWESVFSTLPNCVKILFLTHQYCYRATLVFRI